VLDTFYDLHEAMTKFENAGECKI